MERGRLRRVGFRYHRPESNSKPNRTAVQAPACSIPNHVCSGSKYRPISPITFAPARTSGRSSDDEFVGSGADEDFAAGLGYEEDDEGDADDKGESDSFMKQRRNYRQRYRRQDPKNVSIYHRPLLFPDSRRTLTSLPLFLLPCPNPRELPPQNRKQHIQSTSKNYTVIRFSTEQILEDDFTIEWYDLQPYELLEMHRASVV